jgi:glucose-6-phosphate 1-dehydrogenase
MRTFIDNWRWQGVPFLLTSGKRMARKTTSIVVRFREVPHSMFAPVLGERIPANDLTFEIHPSEAIRLTFQAKSPGPEICMRTVPMRFDYQDGQGVPPQDAYEKVLVDCIHGDQMLFWRQDGLELCWEYLTPILEQCEGCDDQAANLHPYEAGSWGPPQAQRLIGDLGLLDA